MSTTHRATSTKPPQRRRCRAPLSLLAAVALCLLATCAPSGAGAQDASVASEVPRPAEVEVSANGASSSSSSSSQPCNCSSEVAAVQKDLASCEDGAAASARAVSEAKARHESAVAAAGKAEAEAAARLESATATAAAEARAKAEAEAKAERDRMASECDAKLAASDGALRDVRAKLESTEAEREAEIRRLSARHEENLVEAKAERDRVASECDAKLAASDEALRDFRAKLESTEAEREAEIQRLSARHDESLAAAESGRKDAEARLESTLSVLAEAREAEVKAKAEHGQIVVEFEKKAAETERALEEAEAGASRQAEAASKCRLDLAESESERNGAMQEATALRDSVARLKKDHAKQMDGLREKMAEAKKDLERQKKLLKASNDKYYDSRRDLHDRESELRDMHRNAVRQYVNVTLMMEDAGKVADRAMTRLEKFMAKAWSDAKDFASPHLQKVAQVAEPHIETVRKHYQKDVHPHVRSAQKSIAEAYRKHGKPLVDPLWSEYGTPAMEKLSEIRTAMKLSFVSAVQQSSRNVATYLHSTDEGKDRISPRKKRLIQRLQAADENAEAIVDASALFAGVFLFLFFFGEFLLNAALFFLLLPFRPFMFLFGLGRGKSEGSTAAAAAAASNAPQSPPIRGPGTATGSAKGRKGQPNKKA